MRVRIVYESMFGNTARVAAAIAQGFGDRPEVEVLNVAVAAELPARRSMSWSSAGPPTRSGPVVRAPCRQALPAEDGRFGEQATHRGPECAEGESLSEGATSGAVSYSGTELSTTPPESPGRIGDDRRTGRSVLAGADAVA